MVDENPYYSKYQCHCLPVVLVAKHCQYSAIPLESKTAAQVWHRTGRSNALALLLVAPVNIEYNNVNLILLLL